MEFTKEQIEFLKTKRKEYGTISGDGFFDSLLKPERKKIRVEIEVESDLTADGLKDLLKSYGFLKVYSVTELPEVFSREDMIDFGKYCAYTVNPKSLDKWFSERNSK